MDQKLNVTTTSSSWAQEVSILYVDNPVGTGYSFTDNAKGYSTNENMIADNLYEALQQFYTVFDEYRGNGVYITGQSYGGHYVPALGYKVMQHSNDSNFDFKGIAIGNGWIDPINQINTADVYKSMGLVDELEAIEVREREESIRTAIRNKDYLKALQLDSDLSMQFSTMLKLIIFFHFLIEH